MEFHGGLKNSLELCYPELQFDPTWEPGMYTHYCLFFGLPEGGLLTCFVTKLKGRNRRIIGPIPLTANSSSMDWQLTMALTLCSLEIGRI